MFFYCKPGQKFRQEFTYNILHVRSCWTSFGLSYQFTQTHYELWLSQTAYCCIWTEDEDSGFTSMRSSLRARRDRLARREAELNKSVDVKWVFAHYKPLVVVYVYTNSLASFCIQIEYEKRPMYWSWYTSMCVCSTWVWAIVTGPVWVKLHIPYCT